MDEGLETPVWGAHRQSQGEEKPKGRGGGGHSDTEWLHCANSHTDQKRSTTKSRVCQLI